MFNFVTHRQLMTNVNRKTANRTLAINAYFSLCINFYYILFEIVYISDKCFCKQIAQKIDFTYKRNLSDNNLGKIVKRITMFFTTTIFLCCAIDFDLQNHYQATE